MNKIKIKMLNVTEAIADITIALAELGFDVDTIALDDEATITATRIHEYELPGEKQTLH